MNRHLPAGLVITLLLFGCSDQGSDSASATDKDLHTTQVMLPQGHPDVPASGAVATPTGRSLQVGGSGVVKTVLQTDRYTYAEVLTNGENRWLAGGRAPLKTGQGVAWRDGAVMKNFHSKALDREFPELMFVSGFISPNAKLPVNASSGVVLSVSEAAGYSYLEVETESGRQWLALPAKPLSQGDEVSWSGGSTMRNFHSKSLDRTFDSILFLSSIEVASR